MKASRVSDRCSRLAKSFGETTFFWMTEKKISTLCRYRHNRSGSSRTRCSWAWIMIVPWCAWARPNPSDGTTMGLHAGGRLAQAIMHWSQCPGPQRNLRFPPLSLAHDQENTIRTLLAGSPVSRASSRQPPCALGRDILGVGHEPGIILASSPASILLSVTALPPRAPAAAHDRTLPGGRPVHLRS